eukprot:5394045-Pyramimonas_sp.AAC.1
MVYGNEPEGCIYLRATNAPSDGPERTVPRQRRSAIRRGSRGAAARGVCDPTVRRRAAAGAIRRSVGRRRARSDGARDGSVRMLNGSGQRRARFFRRVWGA